MSKIILMPDVRLAPMLRVHVNGLVDAFKNTAYEPLDVSELLSFSDTYQRQFGFGLYTVFSDKGVTLGCAGTTHWTEEEAYEGVLEYQVAVNTNDPKLHAQIGKGIIRETFTENCEQAWIVQTTFGARSALTRDIVKDIGMAVLPAKIRHEGHEQPCAAINRVMCIGKN